MTNLRQGRSILILGSRYKGNSEQDRHGGVPLGNTDYSWLKETDVHDIDML